MSRKSFHSIPETLSFMESLKEKAERMPDLLGFKSSDIAKTYKHLIQLANSLAVVFLQYDLNDLALIMLKYASDADLKLNRYGSPKEKLWEGSLTTYNNLILLFHKVKHFKESLKLVHQAQTFVLNIKKANLPLTLEIEACTHMLSFISLWRVGRCAESVTYLQSSADILNSFIQGKTNSRLSPSGLDNLFGIVAAALASLKLVIEKNKQEALNIIEKALNEVNKNAGCRSFLENLLNFITENMQFRVPEENKEDWLCGKMFTKVFIITLCVPFIDSKTPVIPVEELEGARIENSELSKPFQLKMTEKPIEKLPKIIMEQVNVPKPAKKYFRETSRLKIKHWWENKEFLGVTERVRADKAKGFLSEPRRAKKPNRANQSLNFPSTILNSPSVKYSRNNHSVFDTKYNYDGSFSVAKGFNLDLHHKKYDNICD